MDTNETKIYIALLIAAAALAVLLTFFFITLLRHHKRGLKLYREKVAAEITTLETERKRIASDLHDDFGPLLSAVKLQVSALDANSNADKALVQKINSHLDEVLDKIRSTSNNLVPRVLLRKGFNAALDQYVATINQARQLSIHLERNTEAEPSIEKAVHLFRMVQEMINNTIRHAKADKCSISIQSDHDTLLLKVSDNGVGFNFQKLSRSSIGFGLQNIQSRAEILKARIYINTTPQQGTCYTIECPMHTYEKV